MGTCVYCYKKVGGLVENSDERKTSSDVKLGRAWLLLGWVTTFKQKPLWRSLFQVKLFFRHCHSFSLVYNLRRGYIFKKYTILDARLQLMRIGRVLVLYTGHFTLNAFSALVSFWF